jgi:ABC-type transport system involved in cytochrome c biogenesis ATPase subunit
MLTARDTGRAREALDALDVADLLVAPAIKPSTGQRRQVAVAAGPSLLVVDEPEGTRNAEAPRFWPSVMTTAIVPGGPIVVAGVRRPAALGSRPVLTISLRAAPCPVPRSGLTGWWKCSDRLGRT